MNYIVIIGFAGALVGMASSISLMRKDINRINTNINKIAKQVGVPDTITDELKRLLIEGRKIEAIKRYRMATGAGLIEAKEYVDSLSKIGIYE